MQYYLTLENGIRGAGITPDGTFPQGAVECTQAQYQSADSWTISNGEVVAYTPPLADIQTSQKAVLSASCGASILSGFTSSALGSAYTYPSDDVTQRNIAMATVSGGSLWCESASGWAMAAHTAAEAQQVQKDLWAMIQAAQAKYQTLLAQVAAATTVTEVQAVMWA